MYYEPRGEARKVISIRLSEEEQECFDKIRKSSKDYSERKLEGWRHSCLEYELTNSMIARLALKYASEIDSDADLRRFLGKLVG